MNHDTLIPQINKLIRSGYGVEDIAIKLNCNVEGVRNHVLQLRKHGYLKEWFQGGVMALEVGS